MLGSLYVCEESKGTTIGGKYFFTAAIFVILELEKIFLKYIVVFAKIFQFTFFKFD